MALLRVAAAAPALLLSSSSAPATASSSISIKSRLFSHPPPLLSSSLSFIPWKTPLFRLSCAGQEATAVEGQEEGTQEGENVGESNQRRKLYVANLPWSFSATDIEGLFGQCGTVKDVEIIKQKNGKSRGFSFVTLGSPEEARVAKDKFDSHELLGRIIRVEYAKSLKKAAPPPPAETPVRETRHLVYASNLAWKVRSGNLRDLFSASFKPVSARVVFDSTTGRCAGYGFVSFATEEEAEAAISELDGNELMGRPLRLKISEKRSGESGKEAEVADNVEVQVEVS